MGYTILGGGFIFFLHPYLGKISNLNIFQMGGENHHLEFPRTAQTRLSDFTNSQQFRPRSKLMRKRWGNWEVGEKKNPTWMSQEDSKWCKWLVNGLFHLLINGVFLGVKSPT